MATQDDGAHDSVLDRTRRMLEDTAQLLRSSKRPRVCDETLKRNPKYELVKSFLVKRALRSPPVGFDEHMAMTRRLFLDTARFDTDIPASWMSGLEDKLASLVCSTRETDQRVLSLQYEALASTCLGLTWPAFVYSYCLAWTDATPWVQFASSQEDAKDLMSSALLLECAALDDVPDCVKGDAWVEFAWSRQDSSLSGKEKSVYARQAYELLEAAAPFFSKRRVRIGRVPINALPQVTASGWTVGVTIASTRMNYSFSSTDSLLDALGLGREASVDPFSDTRMLVMDALCTLRAPDEVECDASSVEWFHKCAASKSRAKGAWPFVTTRRCPVILFPRSDEMVMWVRTQTSLVLDRDSTFGLPNCPYDVSIRVAHAAQSHAVKVADAIRAFMLSLFRQEPQSMRCSDLVDVTFATSRTHCLWRQLFGETLSHQCQMSTSDLVCHARILDPFFDS